MITARNASLTYPDGTIALKPFELDIQAGEAVYITGPSGSGKTSLLKLLMGMTFTTTGVLSVLGQSMLSKNMPQIRNMRRRMGPVFQEFRLLEGRSVYENVLLGMRFLDINPHDMKERAVLNVEKVGLAHKLHHRIGQLSWGECQRVAIARAVARRPALIIADEPTGNLDKENALNILRLLESFKSEDTTVIITTHATHLVDMEDADFFIRMDAGIMRIERRGHNG